MLPQYLLCRPCTLSELCPRSLTRWLSLMTSLSSFTWCTWCTEHTQSTTASASQEVKSTLPKLAPGAGHQPVAMWPPDKERGEVDFTLAGAGRSPPVTMRAGMRCVAVTSMWRAGGGEEGAGGSLLPCESVGFVGKEGHVLGARHTGPQKEIDAFWLLSRGKHQRLWPCRAHSAPASLPLRA